MADRMNRSDDVGIVSEIKDRLTHVPGVLSVHHRERKGIHEVVILLDRHDRTIEHVIVDIERDIIERHSNERFDFRMDIQTRGSMDAFLGWTEATRIRSTRRDPS